jgi:hypothetical protein
MTEKAVNFSKFFLRNCEFKLKCTQDWESLEIKQDVDSVRHCSQCQKDVYLVDGAWDLVNAIGRNDCVAIPRTMLIEAKSMKNIGKMSVGHVTFKKD